MINSTMKVRMNVHDPPNVATRLPLLPPTSVQQLSDSGALACRQIIEGGERMHPEHLQEILNRHPFIGHRHGFR